MRQFGVGRPSVREALLHLQQDGARRGRLRRARPRHAPDAAVRHRRAEPARPATCSPRPAACRTSRTRASSSRSGWPATPRSTRPTRTSPSFEAALEANRQSIGDLERFERTDVDFHYVLAVIAAQSDLHRDPRRAGRMAARAAAHDARRRARTSRPMRRTARSSRRSPRAIPTAPSAPCATHLEYVARRYTDIVGAGAMSGLRRHRRLPAEAGRASPTSARLIDANAARLGARRARLPPLRRGRAAGRGGPRAALRDLRRRGGVRRALPVGALRALRRRKRAAGGREVGHALRSRLRRDGG